MPKTNQLFLFFNTVGLPSNDFDEDKYISLDPNKNCILKDMTDLGSQIT